MSVHIRFNVDGVGLWLIVRVIFHAESNKVDELRALYPRIVGVFILGYISLLLLLLVLFCSWLL